MDAKAFDVTRRWIILASAASLLLGSCSNTATTDADAGVDVVADDAEEPAPTPAPAGSPMGGEGWLLFQAVFDGEVDLGLVRPDGSDREQLTTPGGSARDYYPRWLPDGSAVIYSRCMDLWTCRARLVVPDGADRLLLEAIGRQTVHFMWQPTDSR